MSTAPHRSLAAGLISGGVFHLPPGRLASPGVDTLLSAFFPAGVRIAGAALLDDAGDGAARVTGRLAGSFLGVDAPAATAEIVDEGGTPHLRMVLSAFPLDWTPARSFPALAGTMADHFAWGSPSFTLDSRLPDALPAGFETALGQPPADPALEASLRRGLSLEATLTPGPAMGALGWLVGTPRVRGAVEPSPGGAPRLHLRSHPAGEVALGSLSAPLRVELVGVLLGSADDALPWVFARVAADAAWEGITLPLCVSFAEPDPATLTFAAALAEASEVALGALAGLLGGVSLEGLFPEDGPPLDAVALERVSFTLATSRAALLGASARLAVRGEWDASAAGIGLGFRGLALSLDASFASAAPRVEAWVEGTAVVDGTEVAAWAALPSLRFQLGLPPGSEADLSGVFRGLLPELDALPPLLCSHAELAGSARTGELSAAIHLSSGAEPWRVRTGVLDLAVEKVWAAVEHRPGATPANRASVGGRLKIGPAELVARWEVPGQLSLQGTLDPISLEELAGTLTGGWADLPPGFPDVVLEDAWVSLTAGQGEFAFALTTGVEVEGIGDLGTVLFEVRKERGATGFMAGFVVPASFTPAAIWSELEDALGWLTLSDPGLIVSSIHTVAPTGNLQGFPALPSSIEPGVTFFATVELAGPLEPVSRLFDGVGGLNLAAVIAKDVKRTKLIASTGVPAGSGSVGFRGVSLIVSPLIATVEVRSGTTLRAGDDLLDFTMSGILDAKGSLTAALSLRAVQSPGVAETGPEAGWIDPFGAPGLTVYGLGGALSVEAEGWSIAFEGELSAGAGRQEDRVAFLLAFQVTDGKLPSAAVARLRAADPRGITLRRMIRGLTSFDVDDLQVLDQVILRDLMAYLVIDPTGFRSPVDPTFIYRGIGAHADVELFGLDARADYDFHWSTGVYARGALVEPFEVPGVVRLTDAELETGPSFVIDTRQVVLGGDIAVLTGRVRLFEAAEVEVKGRVKRDRFSFFAEARGVPGVRKCLFDVSLVAMRSVRATADVEIVIEGDVELEAEGVKIGTLHFDRHVVDCLFDLQADLKRFRLEVEVDLRLLDDLPRVRFEFGVDRSFSELASMAVRLYEEIQERGWELFERVLDDASALWKLAEAGMFDFADDIGAVLQEVYQLSAEAAATVLAGAGYAAAEAAQALEGAYRMGSEKAAVALRAAGYAVDQVEGVLRSVYRMKPEQALMMLQKAGFPADAVAAHFQAVYAWTGDAAATMLRHAGYAGAETAAAVKGVYNMGSKELARAMEGAGYAGEEAARALRDLYGKSADDVGKILREVGYSSKQIAKVMKGVYRWSADRTAKYMKNTLGFGKKTIENALDSAGYATKEIEKAMSDAWGEVTDFLGL